MKVTDCIFVTIMSISLLVFCSACDKPHLNAIAKPEPPNVAHTVDSTVGASGFFIDNGQTVVVLPSPNKTANHTTLTLARLPTLSANNARASTTSIDSETIKLSLRQLSGTTVDRTNMIAVAFGFEESRVSLVDLLHKKEISVYDTKTLLSQMIGGKQVRVNGVVVDPSHKLMTIGTADGFEIVDYSTASHPVKVREIASRRDNQSSAHGVDVSEHFAVDRRLALQGKIYDLTITGPSRSKDDDTSAIQLIDNATGALYSPTPSTNALLFYKSCIDSIAIDTNYHIALIAPEFSSEHLLVNLNKLSLDADNLTFSLPADAIATVKMPGYRYTNVAIESTNHYVFIAKASGGANYILGKMNPPEQALGITKLGASVISMPLTQVDNGIQYSWEGAYEPHGISTYSVDAAGTAGHNKSVALWTSADLRKIALINLSDDPNDRIKDADIRHAAPHTQYFSLGTFP